MADVVVNTDHIPSVEVEVKPFYKEFRWWLNAATSLSAGAQSVALLLQDALHGYAWFAPVVAVIAAVNAVLGYFSKKDIVSKNKKI